MDVAPTKLARLPLGERLKTFGLTLLFPAIIAGLGARSETAWLEIASYVLALAVTIAFGWWALRQMSATCPHCGTKLEKASVTAKDQCVRVECEECFEWLISDEGTLRAFTQADTAGVDGFSAPVFEGARWPKECIACGAAATRRVEAKARTVHAAGLLVGKLARSSDSIAGIPVCDAHLTAVGLEIEQLGAVRFVFPDYTSRRRYVAGNKGMVPATVAR